MQLKTIPFDLRWDIPSDEWRVEAGQDLIAAAGKETDLFTDPGGDVIKSNSPRLLFSPAKLYWLSALVSVQFNSTFDAGVLVLYANPDYWAKLCFEYSPQGQPMVVSVVNRGFSDDCNSVPIQGNSVYLRMAALGNGFVFHYSTDGRYWNMVRYFRLETTDPVSAGFSVQSPTGENCTAQFSKITYKEEALNGLRNGT